MTEHMTREKFLEMMKTERERWEKLVAMLEDEQMVEPGLEGKWSALDIVAHVTAYERWLVTWLIAAAENHLPDPSPMDESDVESRNAWIYEQNKGRPVHEVWKESQDVFVALVQQIEALDERDLWDPKRTNWFVKPYWKESIPLWQCIAGDSYEHYHQHMPAIRKRLAKLWG